MKTKELRALSKEELIQKQNTLSEDLHKMNQQRYGARVDKPHMFSLIKKDMARIKTILNEKKEKING